MWKKNRGLVGYGIAATMALGFVYCPTGTYAQTASPSQAPATARDGDALIRLAESLEAAGKHEDAANTYEKASDLYLAQGKALDKEAAKLTASGKPDEGKAKSAQAAAQYGFAARALEKAGAIMIKLADATQSQQTQQTAPARPAAPAATSLLPTPSARPVSQFNTKTTAGRQQLFMQLVRESYEREILGTQTAPVKVVVEFHSFDVAAPIVNKVTTVGAEVHIINFGAEPDAPLYPIKARLTITRTYGGDGLVTKDNFYYTYQGFVGAKGYLSKGGDWRISYCGPVR